MDGFVVNGRRAQIVADTLTSASQKVGKTSFNEREKVNNNNWRGEDTKLTKGSLLYGTRSAMIHAGA